MKRPRMERKISNGLFGMGLFTLTVTALLCTLVFYSAFSAQGWNTLRLSAQQIAAGYYAMGSTDEAMAALACEEIRLTLIDSDGTVVYDSAASELSSPAELGNHLSRPEICEALQNGEGRSARYSETLEKRTCYYALVLTDGRILRVAQDSASLLGIFLQALPVIFVVVMVLLVLSLVISYYSTKRLLQPVHNMTDKLDRILEVVPYEELVPLAETIHSDRLLRENASRMRQEFTANVSHELKTPLTSISGYAELIENGMTTQENTPVFAGRIRTEAARMLALVNDILSLSRLDSEAEHEEASKAEFAFTDLAQIAILCAERLRVNAQRAYITLTVKTDKAVINGDARMLEQLCQNLCDNALRYNRPGGRVNLSTGYTTEGVPYLQVWDNGIGIPKEAQNRLFERFYRVDKSRSKETGGTGLGLAIVKRIAIIHGAQIKLESETDKGTCITVTFPV